MRPKKPSFHTVGILTGRHKAWFSLWGVSTKFFVEIPFPLHMYANPNTKFETYRACQSQDTCKWAKFHFNFFSFFHLFAYFAFLAIKCESILRSRWNLVHIKISLKHIYKLILVGILWGFVKLWSIFVVKGLWKIADGVTIIGVAWKDFWKIPRRYDTKPNQCKNYAIEFVIKNSAQLCSNRSQ